MITNYIVGEIIKMADKIKIGIDLDNTINANKLTAWFFELITQALYDNKSETEVHIITNRNPSVKSRQETVAELEKLHINYDELVITANKYAYIIENDITVYFDDTDEYFIDLPESVTVFKIREPGNFDFDHKKWIYGNKTGINIEQK
jgi:hypothetical protein